MALSNTALAEQQARILREENDFMRFLLAWRNYVAQEKAKTGEVIPQTKVAAGETVTGTDSGYGMSDSPSETGRMSPGMEGFFGGISGIGSGLIGGSMPSGARTLGGLLGSVVTTAVPALNMPFGVLSLASRLAPAAERNPLAGVPSVADIQSMRDLFGAYAADQAMADRQAAIDAQNRAAELDPTGYVNAVSPADIAGNPAGWQGNPYGAPDPSVSNPDSPFGGLRSGWGSEFGTSMGNIGAAENAAGMLGGFNDPGDRGGGQGDGGSGEGGGGTGGCFVAGTMVALPGGHSKPIEKIAAGDKVISWDERRSTFEEGKVVEVFPSESQDIATVTLGSGEVITSTPLHRYLTQDSTWAMACELKVGTKLHSGDEVVSVDLSDTGKTVKVWNFRVEPYHTYVVAGQVVHNVKAKGGVLKVRKATTETFGEAGPETAIFVPKAMKKAGIQGPERKVRRTLKSELKALTPKKVR